MNKNEEYLQENGLPDKLIIIDGTICEALEGADRVLFRASKCYGKYADAVAVEMVKRFNGINIGEGKGTFGQKIENVLTDSETYIGENEEKAAALGEEADKIIRKLTEDVITLAKLASDAPEFYSPIHTMKAKNLRDRVLKTQL